MNRKDIIFCKMLNYNKKNLGITDSPYIISEDILKQGLIAGQPQIMLHLRNFILNDKENRMIVWSDSNNNAWAVMNTNRTSLDGSRTIEWTYSTSPNMPKYYTNEYKNPICITTYRQQV